jgi:hypothetical protein
MQPMSRALRWGLASLVAIALLVGALVVLPFRSWLPGGTVADVPTAEVVNGSAFNRLFPAPEAGQELVFTQEKRGFSEARLKQSGSALALLAISDTATAPEARGKFAGSSSAIEGWPLVEQGSQASALLVAERFQVKVIGQGEGLDPDQRHELLEAFDLKGLSALRPTRATRERQALPAGQQQPVRMPATTPQTLEEAAA